MRSYAQIKGHPIHPILIAFPVAFLTGALAFDIVGWLVRWPSVATAGGYLSVVGILSGLVAAVPGLLDYLHAVPPNSSAKARATKHMIVNVSALMLFALGWLFRDRTTFAPGLGSILFQLAGIVLLAWGGWMGGTLVYRNQIGVDHRYAESGKWHEETIEAHPREWAVVARSDELKVNQMKLVHVGEHRIVIARTEAGYSAFDDNCTHKGGPLADGVLACGTVSCPWHGSQFDVHTGAVKAGPAARPITTYRVEQADGQVRLLVPQEELTSAST